MNPQTLRKFTILYVILTIIELSIEYFDITYLRYISKPSLMIVLSAFFYYQSKVRSRFFKFILFGLIFSLFGDIFLMFVDINENFFLAGLVSFLIAHVLYILGFVDNIKSSTKQLSIPKKLITAAPFLVFSISFMGYAHEKLGEMLIPVMVYTSAITVMGITAAW